MAHETMIPCSKEIRSKIRQHCKKKEITYEEYLQKSYNLMKVEE